MIALLATMVALAGATTTDATDVTATSATLNGTVQGATSERFLYGTTMAYGKSTDPPQTVTDGEVHETVTGLSANTTYHFQIVADNDTVVGGNKTFRTGPNPTPPGITDQRSSAVTTSGAHLAATVDPNGAATTYYFQYGRSTSYGNRTARVTVPAGQTPIAVAADISGLRPYTRYHWRLYATNAAGKSPGRDHTLRTGRLATAITLYSNLPKVQYGRGVTLGGRVTGAGTNGMTLTLEQQAFPFGTGFAPVRTTHVSGDGGYLFDVDHVWALTRYRVVTQTQTPLTSAVAAVRSAPRTTIATRLLGRKRARISGTIRPAITGELSLQRRLATGRWAQVKHRTLAAGKGFSFKVFRARRVTRAYRVVVLPARGAYVKATSRKVFVSSRPARARGHRAAAG
jgi:hypothetical protein